MAPSSANARPPAGGAPRAVRSGFPATAGTGAASRSIYGGASKRSEHRRGVAQLDDGASTDLLIHGECSRRLRTRPGRFKDDSRGRSRQPPVEALFRNCWTLVSSPAPRRGGLSRPPRPTSYPEEIVPGPGGALLLNPGEHPSSDDPGALELLGPTASACKVHGWQLTPHDATRATTTCCRRRTTS